MTTDLATKRYSVGAGLLELAFVLVSHFELRTASLPYLKMLYSKVTEGVMLTARVGLERMYVEQIESQHELRQVVEMGKRLPLWLGAPGKAILAYLEAHEIEAVIQGLEHEGSRFFASGKPIGAGKLRHELIEVRKQGYAWSSSERLAGTNAVAAPIFDRYHRVVGAISLGGPESRFGRDTARKYGPMVRETADNISFQLGHGSSGAHGRTESSA